MATKLQSPQQQIPQQSQQLQQQPQTAQMFAPTSQAGFLQTSLDSVIDIVRSPIDRAISNKPQQQQSGAICNIVKDPASFDQLKSANIVSDDDNTDQNAPNENILQLVAQIPNHPLQKFAQKLLIEKPKATSESHSKSATGESTPPKNASPAASTSKHFVNKY